MPRMKTSHQSTAPSLTGPAEAAITETANSQGRTRAKPASKKTAATNRAATATDPDDPSAKAARAKKGADASSKGKARYTRTDALHDALAQGGTRAERAEKVDELYVQNGGESKPSGARAIVDLHVPVLVKFGVVTEDENRRLSLKGGTTKRTTILAGTLALGAFAAPGLARFDAVPMAKITDPAATCAEMEASLPPYAHDVSWLPTFLVRARELGAREIQLSEIRETWGENEKRVRYNDADSITPERVANTRRPCTLNGPSIPQ